MSFVLALLVDNLSIIIPAVFGLVFVTFGVGKYLSNARKAIIGDAFRIAYYTVEQYALKNPGNTINKVAEALQAANAWLQANGWRALSEKEMEAAKIEFQALAGANNTAKAMQNPPKPLPAE